MMHHVHPLSQVPAQLILGPRHTLMCMVLRVMVLFVVVHPHHMVLAPLFMVPPPPTTILIILLLVLR